MSINETIRENMIQLGQEGGRGADSIIKAAMFATALVAAKHVTLKDGKDLYLAYREGYDGEVILADSLKADSLKSQVSTFCTFMQDDVVKNGEVHGRALSILAKLDESERRNSAYNSLVAVNRAQKKKGSAALTNAELEEILTKPESEEKDLVAKLEALLKAAKKIAKDYDTDAVGIHSVVRAIDKSIEETKARAVELNREEEVAPVKAEPKLSVVPQDKPAAKTELAVLLSGIGRVNLGNDKQAVN